MKKIIALTLAVAAAVTPLTAFADPAPEIKDIKDELVTYHQNGNWGSIKKLINNDLRDRIDTTDDVNVNVNENNVRKLNREMLGLQYELGDFYSLFMDSSTTFQKNFIELAERSAPTPVVRTGGTSSNAVNYILNVGPVGQRKATNAVKLPLMGAEQSGSVALKMGIPEIIKAFQLTNKDVKFMPCISYVMNGEDANHLAHYLFDKKDESEWGALRAANGIEDPIEVFYWELGNEIDGMGNEITDARVQTYTEWAIDIVESIKKDFPEQKFVACGRTAGWSDIWRKESDPLHRQMWQWKIFPILAQYVDGMSFHPYYDGYPAEHCMYLADVSKKDMDAEVEKQQIKDENGNLKDMVIVSTESSRFSNLSVDNCDFDSAVCTSHYLNLCFQREWYAGSMFHNAITSNWWCGYWIANGTERVMSPTAKLYKFYSDELGDRFVEAEIEEAENIHYTYGDDVTLDPEEYKPRNISVLASANGDNELKVFITNRKPYSQRNIKFNFNNNYTLTEEKIFTAPNAVTMAYDRASEDLTEVITNEKNEKNFSEYSIKGECVVVLTLKSDKKIAALGGSVSSEGNLDAPDVVDSTFTDITSVYSRNEIAALAADGIITGKTETEFAPNDYITNAETSILLARILGLQTDYKGSLWNDVPQGCWYEGAANALYIEGLVKGEKFNAGEKITVGDLMDILGSYLMKKDNVTFETITNNKFNLSSRGAYCVNKGLFQKFLQNGNVDAAHQMTRAEAADVLYRFYRLVK